MITVNEWCAGGMGEKQARINIEKARGYLGGGN